MTNLKIETVNLPEREMERFVQEAYNALGVLFGCFAFGGCDIDLPPLRGDMYL